jgi:hypothetical protein
MLDRGARTANHLPNHVIEKVASRDWLSVESWIEAHPDQLQRPDQRSQTLLHRICLVRAPASVVSRLLRRAPELAGRPNRDGELALHWAVRLSAPKEIVALLLAAHPAGLAAIDKDGQSPLSIVWERHREDFEHCLERGPGALQSLPAWTRLMHLLRLCGSDGGSDSSTSQKDESTKPLHPLHVASQYPTPPGFFAFLTRVFPQELSERNGNGDLPLHVACSSRFGNRTGGEATKILRLLEMYPKASLAVNARGQLPLHLAVRAGVPWGEGLSELVARSPDALDVCDPVSGLYPFMLAATAVAETCSDEASGGKEEDENDWNVLSGVFRLVCSNPSLLPQLSD